MGTHVWVELNRRFVCLARARLLVAATPTETGTLGTGRGTETESAGATETENATGPVLSSVKKGQHFASKNASSDFLFYALSLGLETTFVRRVLEVAAGLQPLSSLRTFVLTQRHYHRSGERRKRHRASRAHTFLFSH